MMMNTDLIKRIKEYFNLNIYETKVWIALLSKGIASAGEIATISGVPRSRTYDVLESLEKRGFAIMKIGKPVNYIAVKPIEVLEKMKAITLYDAQEKVKSLSNLKETAEYEELEKIHNSGIAPIKTHEITGSLKGRSNVITRLRELIQSAKKEIILTTSVSDFEDKSRVLLPAIEQAIKRNVKVKLALSGPLERVKRINAKTSLKAEHIDSDAKLYIADRKEIMFMITHDNSEEEIAIWLNSPFFANSLALMLNVQFKNGNRKR